MGWADSELNYWGVRSTALELLWFCVNVSGIRQWSRLSFHFYDISSLGSPPLRVVYPPG